MIAEHRDDELPPAEDVERAVRRLLKANYGKTPEEMGLTSLAVTGLFPPATHRTPLAIPVYGSARTDG